MWIRALSLLASLFLAAFSGQVTTSQGIEGYWLKVTDDPHKSAIIHIFRNGTVYDGRILKLRYPAFVAGEKSHDGRVVPEQLVGKVKMDVLNPDSELQGRPIEGLQVISGFRAESAYEWGNATIYNPEDGKTYKCKATLSDDGDSLKIRGFIGISLLGRTQTWTRLRTPDAMGWD
jgi:hypothetical protein